MAHQALHFSKGLSIAEWLAQPECLAWMLKPFRILERQSCGIVDALVSGAKVKSHAPRLYLCPSAHSCNDKIHVTCCACRYLTVTGNCRPHARGRF